MKLKYSLLIAGVAGMIGSAAAQTNDPVLMRVGNDNVTLSEFEMIYKKNLQKDQKITQESLDEYVKLFTNFKLKVQAAKDAGVDTGKSFIMEYTGYKRQLAQPYLKDKGAEEKLARTFAERAAKDLRVSHILIKSKNECDTAAAWKKAMDLSARMKKGLKWEEAVTRYSEDEYSKTNGGDLGWFTAGMWAYGFENAAYNLKNGGISAPVRTSYGYHIIRRTADRPARGEVKVAHIFVAAPEKDAVSVEKGRTKIEEAYAKLLSGASWGEVLPVYSEDRTTIASGGELPAFGIGQMVPSFEDAAYALQKPGDYSKPVQTKYGWHILRLSEKKAPATYEEDPEFYQKKIQKNAQFTRMLNEDFTSRIKPETGFSENVKFWDELYKNIGPGTIRVTRLDSVENAPLFQVGGKQVMYQDLQDYFRPRLPRNGEINFCTLRDKYYMPFVQQEVTAAYESGLENKFPEYKALMKEFKEGMMQFELMKQNVWDKSVEDTAGLRAYFNDHRSEYMWGDRNEAIRFTSADSNALAALLPSLDKLAAGKTTVDKLLKKVNKKETVITSSEVLEETTDNDGLIATHIRSGQVSPIYSSKENLNVLVLTGQRKPEPKELKDVKGAVISRYQEFLENEWLQELRARYPVQVDNKILYKLITR